jgi:hypothetical protein
MRTMLRSKVTLLFMMLGMLLAIPAIALADQVTNNLDNTVDSSLETMNLTVGGANGSAKIYVKAANTYVTDPTTGTTAPDGKNGCNLTGTSTLAVSATSNNTGVATVSQSSPSITGCDDPKLENNFAIANGVTLTVTPVAQGSTTITVSGPGSITVGGETRHFDYLANFTVNVAAAPVTNHAPAVSFAAQDASGNEGSELTTSGAFSDEDDDPLTLTQVSGAGTVDTDNGDGTWSWSHTPNDQGGGTVVVRASDGTDTVTDTFDWSAANVAPTATESFESPVNEGSSFNLALNNPSDPSSADTTAGFTYAFDCGSGYGPFGSSSSTSCSTDDNGTRNVGAKIQDKDNGVTEYTGTVTANNVAPTITNISASVQNILSGKNVSFTGAATDPSSVDTAAAFSWQWSKDGGAYAAGSNPFSTSFSTCGSHSVSAKATDKDGGTSAAVSSDSVNVYNASFAPPVDAAPYVNTVQKGRVIPVKISVSCNGNIANLLPSIQLLTGDKTDGSETTADEIETYTVSSADTTGVMRAADGGYIYNLRVPDVANAYYTVRVNPFGGSNASSNMYALLKTRK